MISSVSGRQARMQPAHFVMPQIGARRIVGIGEIDEPRLRRHRLQHRIDIGAAVLLRHRHGLGAVGQRGDLVDEKRVFAVHHFVARTQIGGGEQVSAVRPNRCRRRCGADRGRTLRRSPRAESSRCLRDRWQRSDLAASNASTACGLGPSADSFEDSLNRIVDALDMRAAADIGRDVENAGLRSRSS